MQTALRHRQTKGAETDMLSLTPPRHTSTLRSPDGWNGYPCVDRRIGIDRGERLIEVRLSREGRREEAHDLFDAYLPPSAMSSSRASACTRTAGMPRARGRTEAIGQLAAIGIAEPAKATK